MRKETAEVPACVYALKGLVVPKGQISFGRIIYGDDAAFHGAETITGAIDDAGDQLIIGGGNMVGGERVQGRLADDAGVQLSDAALDEE